MSPKSVLPIVAIAFLLPALIGCAPPAVLYIPESLTEPPLREVLEDSLPSQAGRRPTVSLRSREEFPGRSDVVLSNDSFVICTSDGGRCATLLFDGAGITERIEEAAAYLLADPHIERVIVALDDDRRRVADTLRTGSSVEIRIQHERDASNSFESLAGEVASSEVGVILLLGRENGGILRSMGVTDGTRRVVAEFLLPAGGDRLAAAGYPLAGVISYSWTEAVDRFLRGDAEGDRINVPLQFFRY